MVGETFSLMCLVSPTPPPGLPLCTAPEGQGPELVFLLKL